jgi:hypothetical protein
MLSALGAYCGKGDRLELQCVNSLQTGQVVTYRRRSAGALSIPCSLPVVVTHEIKPNQAGVKLTFGDDRERELVELKVAQPDRYKERLEFRTPDLVWHQWHGDADKTEFGFIVIVNSRIARNKQFGPRWLQRFDRTGNQVGSALDLDEEAKKVLGHDRLEGANWEGLGWFEAGKRLVLVHDEPNKVDDIPVALVVDLPSSWS